MENITVGLAVSVIGIGVVMILLVLLAYVLGTLKAFSNEKELDRKPDNVPQQYVPQVSVYEVDDKEVIAAITAAMAASLQTGKFTVRSIRRADNWTQAAREQ